jgi:hypothetical protein
LRIHEEAHRLVQKAGIERQLIAEVHVQLRIAHRRPSNEAALAESEDVLRLDLRILEDDELRMPLFDSSIVATSGIAGYNACRKRVTSRGCVDHANGSGPSASNALVDAADMTAFGSAPLE